MKILQNLFNKNDKNTNLKLIFAFVLGLFLLLTARSPKKKLDIKTDSNIQLNNSYEKDLEVRLENLLSQVSGVGNVKVMITLSHSKEIVIAQDTNSSLSTTKEIDKSGAVKETCDKKSESKKIIVDGKNPLVLKEIEPKIEGIIIIAQGAGNIYIKSDLIKSAQTILNVEAHKIQVMKMK
jgi:hypothetical protein